MLLYKINVITLLRVDFLFMETSLQVSKLFWCVSPDIASFFLTFNRSIYIFMNCINETL